MCVCACLLSMFSRVVFLNISRPAPLGFHICERLFYFGLLQTENIKGTVYNIFCHSDFVNNKNPVHVLQPQLHLLPREGQAVRRLRRRQMDRDGEGGAGGNRRHCRG